MAPGAQGAGPSPGMPGVPGRPPGWRRRGRMRPRRTGRTARGRRSATGRPHQAGRGFGPAVQGCCGQHRVLEFRVLAAAEGGLGQEPLAQSLQGQRVGPAGPAPVQRVRGDAEEHLAGKVLSRGCRGQVRWPAGRCQRRARARQAGGDGQSRRPRSRGASLQACHDGKADQAVAMRPPSGCPPRRAVAAHGCARMFVRHGATDSESVLFEPDLAGR